ncbi:hypothetical protein AM228_02110 [Planktothricoides sp. SR001]|nr:hypothetical protein AM228_02110 [Planktothricoides sp. SR001]
MVLGAIALIFLGLMLATAHPFLLWGDRGMGAGVLALGGLLVQRNPPSARHRQRNTGVQDPAVRFIFPAQADKKLPTRLPDCQHIMVRLTANSEHFITVFYNSFFNRLQPGLNLR